MSIPPTECKSNFANDPFRWDEKSSATKVPTEMVQTALALAQPTTPPSSPNLSPSKCFVALSDAQELVSETATSSGETDVTDKELAQLASNKFNGRQVSYLR